MFSELFCYSSGLSRPKKGGSPVGSAGAQHPAESFRVPWALVFPVPLVLAPGTGHVWATAILLGVDHTLGALFEEAGLFHEFERFEILLRRLAGFGCLVDRAAVVAALLVAGVARVGGLGGRKLGIAIAVGLEAACFIGGIFGHA